MKRGDRGKEANGLTWRLAIVMAERDMSPKELIEKTGFNPATISKWRGSAPHRVDWANLAILCDVLKCTPGDLIQKVG